MRTFVLIAMIALLPLRMWAAEGMAVRMAQAELVSAGAIFVADGMPEDCPMMAEAKSESPLPGEESGAPASHCVVCHLCAASACFEQTALEQGPAPAGPRQASVVRFESADLARDLRPPIS